jgi:GBP family porin
MMFARILALMLVLLTGTVFAANITLYGIVDTGLATGNVSRQADALGGYLSASTSSMTSGVLVGGSRWGLTSTENLGQEWSTNFVFEAGVMSNDGMSAQGGLSFGRQTTLGISKKGLGLLEFGRQMNLASRYFLDFDPFHGGTSQLALGTSMGNANVIRYDNLIQAQFLPTDHLSLGLSYSFAGKLASTYETENNSFVIQPQNDSFSNAKDIRIWSAGAHYKDGPLTLAAGFDQALVPANTPKGFKGSGPVAWLAGAQIDVKFATISLAYGQGRNGAFGGQLPGAAWVDSGLRTTTVGSDLLFAQGYNHQSSFVGIVVPMKGGLKGFFNWQAMQPQGALNQTAGYATQQVYSGGFIQNLSQRLSVYLYASQALNYAMISTAKSSVVGMGFVFSF